MEIKHYFLIAFSSDIITKIISLILFIKRFSYISKENSDNKTILTFPYLDNAQNETNEKIWSKTSIFKFSINIILTILSIIIGILCYIKYLKNESQTDNCILIESAYAVRYNRI